MDGETRNAIQRSTQAARQLVEHDYAEQLEGVFDIRLDGTVEAEPGEHLDAAHRALRTKLVAAVEHQRTSGMSTAEAVSSYLREAAFTTLNRFVALKMLEARELVQECVSKGSLSAGFSEFTGLAPGLVQEPDHGYRLYIESLFDEIGREVRVLFERRNPANLLWPRRPTLLELLNILNAPALTNVWIEDETIGWVYQYFNGEDERRRMREESQVPRNSRELAVRNQFFTPRYVVQFLVDNTLGRTWFEMMRGETKLKDLEYLVRRRYEFFLAESEAVPDEPESVSFGESPNNPFPVFFRPKKDPRDITILDPACGSGHFLLYAFDLLLTIYEEAWHDENAAPRVQSNTTLREDYPELNSLSNAAPELILRYNLHGIEIDPRAAQIASLALWLRSQRAFQAADLSRVERPVIAKTNIVVAEPMPDEANLRDSFVASLDHRLGQLVDCVFNTMSPAAEAGYLLRLAEHIQDSIREIYGERGTLFRSQDESEWTQASKDLNEALETFDETAAADQTFSRKLFADDAARGLGFIDICSRKYDVIVMNPPFGESSIGTRSLIKTQFPSSAQDIFQAFVERATELLVPHGRAGILSARTGFFMGNSESWRRNVIWNYELEVFTDLGLGVLDDALVEAAAYCIVTRTGGSRQSPYVTRHLDTKNKQTELVGSIRSFRQSGRLPQCGFAPPIDVIRKLPSAVFAYWAPASYLARFLNSGAFQDVVAPVRQGLATADDFRFVRLRWEVPTISLGKRWHLFSKGGEYSPPFDDIHLLVDWDEDGQCLRSLRSARVQNTDWYHQAGVTYSVRTASAFAAKILPKGCIFSHIAQSWFHEDREHLLASALYFSCRAPQSFIELAVGGGDVSTSGSAARRYTTAVVHSVPADAVSSVKQVLSSGGHEAFLENKAHELSLDETSLLYSGIPLFRGQSLGDAYSAITAERQKRIENALQCIALIDRTVSDALKLSPVEQQFIDEEIGPHVWDYVEGNSDPDEIAQLLKLSMSQLVETGIQRVGAKRWITKKSYFVDRRTELVCHIASTHPRDVLATDHRSRFSTHDFSAALLSHIVGVALGRWKPGTLGRDEIWKSFSRDPFERPAVSAMVAEPRSHPSGILVDDVGAASDIGRAVEVAIAACWPDRDQDATLAELAKTLGYESETGIRTWLQSEFFRSHVSRYSKSRRAAPIYWQLATPSASYSVWLYYHRLTADTLFRVLHDHISPKLHHEERQLTNLINNARVDHAASHRKEIATQKSFVNELREFRDEIARVAPLWNPNLNDGVILNFAPLWRLVPQHKQWQNKCKAVWRGLCEGDFDWAHLAMHLWPERVVPKCGEDRSFAITHGLEDALWCEGPDGKSRSRKVTQAELDSLIGDRASLAVKAALKSLLNAPAPARGKTVKRRASRIEGKTRPASISQSNELQENAASYERSRATCSHELLGKVMEAIGEMDAGARKSDVIGAAGITASEWTKAIKALLADGSVAQTGQRRGARYHLRGRDS